MYYEHKNSKHGNENILSKSVHKTVQRKNSNFTMEKPGKNPPNSSNKS